MRIPFQKKKKKSNHGTNHAVKLRSKAKYKRKKVLAKSDNKCIMCGIDDKESHLTLDHIIPIREGGDSHISNLQAVCEKCRVKYKL